MEIELCDNPLNGRRRKTYEGIFFEIYLYFILEEQWLVTTLDQKVREELFKYVEEFKPRPAASCGSSYKTPERRKIRKLFKMFANCMHEDLVVDCRKMKGATL